MNHNFSKTVDRRLTHSLKWEVEDDVLPMWVADMDFEAAPAITAALQKRLEQKIFGYDLVPEAYFEAYQSWWKRRYGEDIKKEWLMFCEGVVAAVSSIVRRVTNIRDNVLIQAPVYNIFYNSILNNGRHVLSSDLVYSEGRYEIDFDDLEAKLALPLTTMMILCNPHNPVGKIWDDETLAKIGDLCDKHHVIVLSDEIHCDLTKPGKMYTPYASIHPHHSITCMAPSKTFNIAGLKTSCIMVPDEDLRAIVERGINTDEVAEPNSFAIDATIAGYDESEDWLEELRLVIERNKQTVYAFIREALPELYVVEGEATYLIWIDCSKIEQDADQLCDFLKKEAGLYVSEGSAYGPTGASFFRLNVACSQECLQEGLTRLKKGITLYKERRI